MHLNGRAERIAKYPRDSRGANKAAICARDSRASFVTSDVNGVHLYLIGEQQGSEDYTDCSPWWLDEVGGEAFGTRSRGAGSRAARGHRGRDSAPAESSDEQSRARARIQVTTQFITQINKTK